MNTGNFLDIVASRNGIEVGYLKAIVFYSTEKELSAADLTAAAIQAELTAETAVGIFKDWLMVAGTSVAERNTPERADGSMGLVRGEILGDTFTFADNSINRDVLGRISGNVMNCIVIDDMGQAFGVESLAAGKIKTMKVNFTTKTTNGFSKDLTNEKTIAITAKYLVGSKNFGVLDAQTEVEEIDPKISLIGKISSVTTHTASSIVFKMDLFSRVDNTLLTALVTTGLNVDVSVNGNAVTASGAFATNQLTLTLTKTVADFNTATDIVRVRFNTEAYYLTEIVFNIADFIA